ncbi:hypothetical protein [Mariniphaga sp.]|uniref:hypothetical protein n=1 Tax=Mariniphaga sp. TaxID=1954475 RepID=UPI003569E22D
MNTNILVILKKIIPVSIVLILLMGCERELENLQPVTFPDNPEVFIDGFSSGLNYSAFGGSVPTAFDVDNDVTYNNSKASMRFDVPNAGDPEGAYAGGVFSTEVGRDLSSYNALTFWAKASQSANLDLVGLGNDLGASKYQVTISGLSVSTSWKKFIIPLPDPSKLKSERGMFFYSVGPAEEKGYSFWIDELKFENLGTIAHPQFGILNGEDQTETSFIGVAKTIGGLTSIYNMPSGVNQEINISPAYFQFESSNPSIASVDEAGNMSVTGGPGEAKITASVGGETVDGSLTVQSQGEFQHAPTPTHPAENVISIFSNAYPNAPVNYYNGYWQPYQTTGSADFEVAGDHVLHYTDFNFVGIEFSSPTINASSMTHLHMDIFIPNVLTTNARISFEVVDFGADVSGTVTKTITPAQSQQWVSFDISFSELSGLSAKTNLAQIILVDVNNNISNFYVDNIYFYNEAVAPSVPATAAPAPTHSAANVISVFSDAYSDIAGTNVNPDWGQATATSIMQIQGNNTLKMAGLNYQGIELGSSQDVSGMDFLHLDFWSANSTAVSIFLISPGPVEKGYSLTVPTSGWTSIDIPLSTFSPVNLSDVIQLKFDGNGDIYLDNIYFRKN